jgi:hypothetical protein
MASTLFIFVSGFRIGYRSRVLDAVGRPIGSSQTFQYSIGKNLSEQGLGNLSNLEIGTRAMVVFVDRNATNGYRYRAARKATFASTTTDSGRAEITLVFGGWPVPAANQDFSSWVATNLAGAPRLTNNNRNEESDGQYAIVGSSPPDDMFESTDGWRQLCEWLSTAQVLATSEKQTTIFARVDVLGANENRVATWRAPRKFPNRFLRRWNRDATLALERSHEYRVRVNYYFPLQRTNQQAEIPYSVKFSPGVEALAQTIGTVNAEARTDEFTFKLAALGQRSHESVVVEFGPASGEFKGLVAPRMELQIRPRFSIALSLCIVGIGILWVWGAGNISRAALEGATNWHHFGGPALQFLAVLAMFRVFGAKLT